MKSIKRKEKIGTALYLIAIIFLLISCFQMGANIENSFFKLGGWIAILVASVYTLWLSREKKKINEK